MKNISFIFPIKNEKNRVYKINDFIKWCIFEKIKNFELIVVDNGSNKLSYSHTKKIVNSINNINIKHFFIKKSSRGAAIKYGIRNSTKNFIAICSIDNAWDLEFYKKGYDLLTKKKIEIIYGPKNHSKSKVKRPIIRKIISFFCSFFLRFCFGSLIKEDTQCIKIFNKKKINFLKIISDVNFFHECEFYLLSKIYNQKVISIPVRVFDVKKKINFYYLIKFIIEAIQFRFSKKFYKIAFK